MVSKVHFFSVLFPSPQLCSYSRSASRGFSGLKAVLGEPVCFKAPTPLIPVHIQGPRSHLKLQNSFPPSPPLPRACPKGSCLGSKCAWVKEMPVFWPIFKSGCPWSGVPRRVRTVPLQGVCVWMGYLRAALEKLGLTGLLAFLSRFCSDTGPLLLHNLNLNYYF